MLSDAHFYYSLTRKYVVLFGNLFNNISLIRTHKDTGQELERIKVPITFGAKEKYTVRLDQDPDLQKEVALTLPRMSFDLVGMNYDAGRKQNSLLRQAKSLTPERATSQYMGVPYDLQFELNIYARTIDDGLHIVEQILPYFNPDYTVTINSVPEVGFLKDIPIILDSVSQNIQHEGNFDTVRYVFFTLTFSMKAYFFGPISKPKIIRQVITNIFDDDNLSPTGLVRLNVNGGNNATYKIGETVYQGDSYDTATAYATVLSFKPDFGKLYLNNVQGQFRVNTEIRSTTSNASFNLSSFEVDPIKLANIVIDPDPLTANVGDDYGFTTTITEWPNT